MIEEKLKKLLLTINKILIYMWAGHLGIAFAMLLWTRSSTYFFEVALSWAGLILLLFSIIYLIDMKITLDLQDKKGATIK